jgi:diaminopimelate decarboxylase
MNENLACLQDLLERSSCPGRIFYSHKVNKSLVFVRQALLKGASIEVSSIGELRSALCNGFCGERICCGGIKNLEYIWLAVQHGCLISVDSIEEIEQIACCSLESAVSSKVILRINNPDVPGRRLKTKPSKFGILKQELEQVFKLLKDNSTVILRGFHFHLFDDSFEIRRAVILDTLELMREAHVCGFSPDLINIGGGFRGQRLHDQEDLARYFEWLAEALLNGSDRDIWGASCYDLVLNDRGKVSGREKFLSRFSSGNHPDNLYDILTGVSDEGPVIAETIAESMFELLLEPGFFLVENCGITLVKVLGTKIVNQGDCLVLVDANGYSLSWKFLEWMTDPVLLRSDSEPDSEGEQGQCSAYIGGNLCRSDDLLMQKKVDFPRQPRRGDLLAFINTASYLSDFEDCSPHMQPTGRKFVAIEAEKAGEFKLMAEEQYFPFLTDQGNRKC